MKLGRFLLMLGGLAALAVVCLAVVHFLVMPLIVHRHDVVRAPQLLGSTVSEARETAAAVGLDIEIVRRDAHPSQPAGTVIDQQPVPGLAMRQGRRIALVTSSGPAAGAVPALAGLSPRQAGATLQREDYRLGRALHVRLPDRAAEVVMCQSPPAGTHLRKGRQGRGGRRLRHLAGPFPPRVRDGAQHRSRAAAVARHAHPQGRDD